MKEMKEIELSIGYSGDFNNLKAIIDESQFISSVYTGGLAQKIPGGRPQYIENLDLLKQQTEYARNRNVDYELALNSPCGFPDKSNKSWWNDLREYLKDIEKTGVTYIVASHPFLIEQVKSHTTMKVVASTICEISTVRSALFYEKLGADIIIPSMNINYELNVLKDIKKSLKEAKIRLMVNEHCLGDCPWRRFHHNHYAHSNVEMDYHFNCKSLFLKEPYLFLTNNTIRPEDTEKYYSITKNFKIVGRLVPIQDLTKRIRAYSNKRFAGNYLDLIDSKMAQKFKIPNDQLSNLFSKKIACDKVCDTCNYCQELYKSFN